MAAGSRLDFVGTADAVDIGRPGIVLSFWPGTVTAGTTSTGTFATLGGLAGGVRDVTVGAGPMDLPAFVTLGGYTFDLRFLPSGSYGQDQCYVEPEPGQQCTPFQSDGPPPFPEPNPYGLSPFMLANQPSGDGALNSAAWFNVVGTVHAPDGSASDFYGTISSDFQGASFQEALYYVENGGVEGLQFAGSFVTFTATPEPSAYALVGAGLLGVAGVGRRRRPTTA